MNNWARELSQLTSRQIAKQISNHCNQQQIWESVCQIIRQWANDGVSPFPIALGPIDSDLTLFNLSPTKGATQECEDSCVFSHVCPGHVDLPGEACTIVRVTARATGDSSNTDRTPFFPVGQSMAKGSSTGIVTGLDIINDPLAALLFKTLTSRSHGSLMHEQASGGSAVALARIPKNNRCLKDSKKNMTPSHEGRISIRTPDQEVGMVHLRATERLET